MNIARTATAIALLALFALAGTAQEKDKTTGVVKGKVRVERAHRLGSRWFCGAVMRKCDGSKLIAKANLRLPGSRLGCTDLLFASRAWPSDRLKRLK